MLAQLDFFPVSLYRNCRTNFYHYRIWIAFYAHSSRIVFSFIISSDLIYRFPKISTCGMFSFNILLSHFKNNPHSSLCLTSEKMKSLIVCVAVFLVVMAYAKAEDGEWVMLIIRGNKFTFKSVYNIQRVFAICRILILNSDATHWCTDITTTTKEANANKSLMEDAEPQPTISKR